LIELPVTIRERNEIIGKHSTSIELNDEAKKKLQEIVNKRTNPRQMLIRARIILMTYRKCSVPEIRTELKVSKNMIAKWRKRFSQLGIDGLNDDARPGRPEVYDAKIRHKIAAKACDIPEGKTHWSIRELAASLNVDRGIVERVLKAESIKPHLIKYYHHSTDPEFEEKMLTIVGLYLNPPENAIVLSVDEKTGIQALDRTQPVLPLKPHGKIKNIPFEYKRLGTTSLIAALDVHRGNVTGVCEDRHTHVEFLSFLQNLVKKCRRKNREIHIIMDNYSAHKHHKVKEWVADNSDVYVHFTPTHAFWLNQIDIWFSILGRKVLKQGVFSSIKDLTSKIKNFIKDYNQNAKPFAWKYTGHPLKVK